MREKDIPVGADMGIACVILPPCMEEGMVLTALGDSLRDSDGEHNVKLVRDGVVYRAKSLRHIDKNEYLTTNKSLYLQQ
jgi:hypothetical protein